MFLLDSREEPECWERKDDRAWQEGGEDVVETLKDLSRAVSKGFHTEDEGTRPASLDCSVLVSI